MYDVRGTILFAIWPADAKIANKTIVHKIVPRPSYIVHFLLLVSFLVLSNLAFSQQPDSVRRPVRTKTTGPRQVPQQQSRIGSSIVDDSTKNIYGPTTTRWTTEREMFTAKTNFRSLDTSIVNYHRWTYVQKLNNFYHDLGNNGTALNPIFPLMPSAIGASAGFHGYAPYWNLEDLKLYDTKSPYTRMYIVWGGQGRAATRVEYSRNINPKWNITFNYRPILTDKQVLRNGRADRNVISHYYDLYSHYTTKNDRYKVVAAYQRIRHRTIENGGLTFQPLNKADSTYAGFFGNVNPNLTRASSYEQHNKLHLFHQINVWKIQAYHIADFETQVNWYKDDLGVDPRSYYDFDRIDTVTNVLDSTRFKTQQHQIGIKGQIGRKNNLFYNGWLKFRKYELWNRYMTTDTLSMPGSALEKYVGGEIQYALDSLQHIYGLIEVLDGGYSRVESIGHMRWFDFSAIRRTSKPTFLQTAYSGHFDLWSNDFKPVESIHLSAFPKVQVGPLFISPGLTFTSFSNYIYFAKRNLPDTVQQVLPAQTSSFVSFATPQVSMDLRFLKKLHLRPQILYTRVLTDADSVLRIPELFVNTQLTFEGELFKGAMQVQIGIDVHWHSAYKPMGYDPVTQTFYNQDNVRPPQYLLADVFLNGKIKRGRFFIKYHNLVQRFNANVGYMPTPYYRGVPSILDFGFELMLFD